MLEIILVVYLLVCLSYTLVAIDKFTSLLVELPTEIVLLDCLLFPSYIFIAIVWGIGQFFSKTLGKLFSIKIWRSK
jgi:hypothetical protein